ncbi:MAG: tetratricopeptide repeat protein [Halofilum sp. (in: g-proteobacteria)]
MMIRLRLLLLPIAFLVVPFAFADEAEDLFNAGVEAADDGNHDEAAERWREAARLDHADAAFRLGALYQEGRGVEQDDARAVEWFRRAADNDSESAWFNLGHMYARGQGVEKDAAEAVRWYEKAARNENAYAQYALGMIHFQGGPGVQPDMEATWFWLTVAADNFGANAFRDNANDVRRQAEDRMNEEQRRAAGQRLRDWQAEHE